MQTKGALAHLVDVSRHVGWQAHSGAGLEVGALHHFLVSCLHDSVLTQIQSAHPLHTMHTS